MKIDQHMQSVHVQSKSLDGVSKDKRLLKSAHELLLYLFDFFENTAIQVQYSDNIQLVLQIESL